MTTMTQDVVEVIGGVDTHKDTHTAAAVDPAGRVLGSRQFEAAPAGYRALLAWLASFGMVTLVGVEGTGAYGTGLARYLAAEQVAVVEIDRPDRKARRWQGKSDPVDAEAAARAALTARRTGTPKDRDGRVEALRSLRVARRSAVKQRADVIRQMQALVVTAAEPLRTQLRELDNTALVERCATARPDPASAADPITAARIALRHLARRHQRLGEEIDDLDELLAPLVEAINPALLAMNGIGTEVAGQLLVTAGDNPDRLRNEAAFAMLCGVAPLPASSGRTTRYRLNRGGDRQANAAIYVIVLCRLRWHEPTRAYAARRRTEGLSTKEIIRCLKRYIARDIHHALTHPTATPAPTRAA
jgi:transposase